MTFNSSDEINQFKKYLNPKEFQFVELLQNKISLESTAFNISELTSGKIIYDSNNLMANSVSDSLDKDQSWFQQDVCRQGVDCDILIVSGHFAGSFFGDSYSRQLSLFDLEKASCHKSCDGILKKPRETFLFGCNTLADKSQDHRTPEEYVHILVGDGFSYQQAMQIAAFRYSPLGSSNRKSMERIFSSTPNIYGFSSTAPLGNEAGPLLNSYMKSTGATYVDWLQGISGPKENKKLSASMKGTSFFQTRGDEHSGVSHGFCALNSTGTSNFEKFEWIKKVLKSNGWLESIFEANYAIEKIFPSQTPWTELQSQQIEELKQIRNWSLDARQVISSVDGILNFKIQVLHFLKFVGGISQEESEIALRDEILRTFEKHQRSVGANSQGFERELCTSGISKLNFKLESQDYTRMNEAFKISTILCLKDLDTYLTLLQGRVLMHQLELEIFADSGVLVSIERYVKLMIEGRLPFSDVISYFEKHESALRMHDLLKRIALNQLAILNKAQVRDSFVYYVDFKALKKYDLPTEFNEFVYQLYNKNPKEYLEFLAPILVLKKKDEVLFSSLARDISFPIEIIEDLILRYKENINLKQALLSTYMQSTSFDLKLRLLRLLGSIDSSYSWIVGIEPQFINQIKLMVMNIQRQKTETKLSPEVAVFILNQFSQFKDLYKKIDMPAFVFRLLKGLSDEALRKVFGQASIEDQRYFLYALSLRAPTSDQLKILTDFCKANELKGLCLGLGLSWKSMGYSSDEFLSFFMAQGSNQSVLNSIHLRPTGQAFAVDMEWTVLTDIFYNKGYFLAAESNQQGSGLATYYFVSSDLTNTSIYRDLRLFIFSGPTGNRQVLFGVLPGRQEPILVYSELSPFN